MSRKAKWIWAVAAAVVLAVVIPVGSILLHGVSARDPPTGFEAVMARTLRHFAVPSGMRDAPNPVAASAGVLKDAREHFADHCATCHANDGSGKTAIGQNLYPKAPDMREAGTQSLSDGEIFYIIHNGIRLTGMPAWGGDDAAEDQDSWKLVHFIRHLPQITEEEIAAMKTMNPKSPGGAEDDDEAEKFLRGDDTKPAPPHHH